MSYTEQAHLDHLPNLLKLAVKSPMLSMPPFHIPQVGGGPFSAPASFRPPPQWPHGIPMLPGNALHHQNHQHHPPNHQQPQQPQQPQRIDPSFFKNLQGHPNSQNQDDPKPTHSYIGLIAMAILASDEKKLVLSDIYQWILDNYAYFRSRGPGWRNSIRHNLSLNDCFVKAGRSANGKGHYWSIHAANRLDFERGDFRRRRAQRRVRRAMGLAVPDDDDDSPPCTPPISLLGHAHCPTLSAPLTSPLGPNGVPNLATHLVPHLTTHPMHGSLLLPHHRVKRIRKRRTFDVESLLASSSDDDEITVEDYSPRTHELDLSMHGHSTSISPFALQRCAMPVANSWPSLPVDIKTGIVAGACSNGKQISR